ncbi:MAG: hypothetical protein ND866_01335 [Pyrinomonadaceae bacterium]|nr:hypothetical protein [Pyrinomonadaceae bacterium]
MLPSSRGLLVFVLMLLIFSVAAQPITDPDFWWHLRTGQYIVETKSIPYTDIFSTLRFGSEWVTHEWLSEVFIYSVFRTLGYGGLIAIFSFLITAAFWIVYQRCRKRGVHRYVAGFALLLGAAATMPTWGVRPQMFSLLFGSIFISFLDRYSGREAMPSIWWLAPLMILWVNMHAGFALGLVLILLTIAGLLLDWLLLRKDSLADVWRRTRPLCWVLIICGAAVSLNPSGIRIYSYPFETLTSPAMMQYINEWKSPDFHEPMFQALGLLIVATFSVLAVSNKRPRPGELLLLAATGWATLRSARNAPFFALVAIPLLAEHSWDLITTHPWGRRLNTPEKPELRIRPALKIGLTLLLLVLGLTVAALSIQQAVAKQVIVEAREFPAAAVDFMVAQRPPQPIYNDYIWGGYLIWRLYPGYRVYIDGRADVYGDGLINEFLQVKDGKTAWREPLDNHGIRTVLVKPDEALASLLRQDGAWQNVFEDKYSVIFVRR